VVVLLAATLVSFWSRDYLDAGAILAMLLLTTVLGFRQEYAAERSMAALERLGAPVARVLRDGVPCTVAARDLVTGDIVFIEAGGLIPADLRLLEVHSLRSDESTLTGESLPVDKDAAFLGESGTALGTASTWATWGRP
jgi:Ca2+-transporting ATPase